MPAVLSIGSVLMSSCTLRTPFSSKTLSTSRRQLRARRQVHVRRLHVSHKVEIEHQGQTHVLEVPEDASILEVALDNDLQLPHDCQLGVCMTCPAKLVSGEVDQSGSMLSEDVAQKGYALLCVSQPRADCKIKTISEDEVLDLQLVTSQY